MRRSFASASAVLGAGLFALAWSGAAQARAPVVVELFTAQGCSSCPEADKRLADLAARKGVIALTFPVDYWDYLGWADTFAQPGFTERQRAYARRLKVREIYTPEVVVDGAGEASGLNGAAVDALVDGAAKARAPGPGIRALSGGSQVRVSPSAGGKGAHADVWLIRYNPVVQTVKVKAGDNRGKTLVQADVVRELRKLGTYTGGVRTYPAPKPGEEGLKTLILVQGVRGGPILSLRELDAKAG